jgi:hypothetical protein
VDVNFPAARNVDFQHHAGIGDVNPPALLEDSTGPYFIAYFIPMLKR